MSENADDKYKDRIENFCRGGKDMFDFDKGLFRDTAYVS